MEKWPVFLGMVQYYKSFCKNWALKAAPPYRLTKKDEKFVFSPVQVQAFKEYRRMPTTKPVLVRSHPHAELEIHVDAYRIGVGVVLKQRINDGGHPKPINYFFRATNVLEQRLPCHGTQGIRVWKSGAVMAPLPGWQTVRYQYRSCCSQMVKKG